VFYFLLQALLISCKRSEFNLYEGQTYDKFESIPLASKGWHHRKSRGDFFTIQKYREVSKYFYTYVCPVRTHTHTIYVNSVNEIVIIISTSYSFY
jgi:hypothetical protein